MKQLFIIIVFTVFPSYLMAQFTCGDTITDARDGKKYPTVLIGTQCWMAKSLDIGIMLTDSMWPSDNQIIEKYCYNDSVEYCALWGGLYTWDEMMNYHTYEGAQGICPDGWHIPTDNEIKHLEIELGMTPAQADIINNWRGTTQGTQMLPGGGSGFDILFAGARTILNTFMAGGIYGYIYTSSESGNNAWRRCVRTNDSRVGRFNTFSKSYAFSVRCILGDDTTSINPTVTNSKLSLTFYYDNNTVFIDFSNTSISDSNVTIQIFGINGNIVYSQALIVHADNPLISIHVPFLTPGLYVVRAMASNSIHSGKLIIF